MFLIQAKRLRWSLLRQDSTWGRRGRAVARTGSLNQISLKLDADLVTRWAWLGLCDFRRGGEDNTDSPQHALIGEVIKTWPFFLDSLLPRSPLFWTTFNCWMTVWEKQKRLALTQISKKKLILFIQVHKELVAGKAKLEYSVHVKTHSLLIDLTKCLPSRKVTFSCPIIDWSCQ